MSILTILLNILLPPLAVLLEHGVGVLPKSASFDSLEVTSMKSKSTVSESLEVSSDAEFSGDVFMEKGLTVQGTVVGSGPYVDSSDERFKKNIQDLNGALGKVIKLRGVTYELRTDEFPKRNFDNSTQMGFIAQEVEQVVPELVVEDSEGFKAVSYARSTALLVNAIQELYAELAVMRKEVQTLRQEVADGTVQK